MTTLHAGQKRRHRLKQHIFRPMLSRCGENEHHFLVSQLKRKRFQPETVKYICVCVCDNVTSKYICHIYVIKYNVISIYINYAIYYIQEI